jgi:hypothetical protein
MTSITLWALSNCGLPPPARSTRIPCFSVGEAEQGLRDGTNSKMESIRRRTSVLS